MTDEELLNGKESESKADNINVIPKQREYNKNQYLVPNEIPIGNPNPFVPQTTAFKTSDKEEYFRSGITGVIYSRQRKIKGKAAVKAAKKMRHQNGNERKRSNTA